MQPQGYRPHPLRTSSRPKHLEHAATPRCRAVPLSSAAHEIVRRAFVVMLAERNNSGCRLMSNVLHVRPNFGVAGAGFRGTLHEFLFRRQRHVCGQCPADGQRTTIASQHRSCRPLCTSKGPSSSKAGTGSQLVAFVGRESSCGVPVHAGASLASPVSKTLGLRPRSRVTSERVLRCCGPVPRRGRCVASWESVTVPLTDPRHSNDFGQPRTWGSASQ